MIGPRQLGLAGLVGCGWELAVRCCYGVPEVLPGHDLAIGVGSVLAGCSFGAIGAFREGLWLVGVLALKVLLAGEADPMSLGVDAMIAYISLKAGQELGPAPESRSVESAGGVRSAPSMLPARYQPPADMDEDLDVHVRVRRPRAE